MLKKGSITVEGAIVIPFVLVVFIMLIMFAVTEYDKAVIKTYSQYCVNAVADYENPKYKLDTATTIVDKKSNYYADSAKRVAVEDIAIKNLYWRFFRSDKLNDYLELLGDNLETRCIYINAASEISGTKKNEKKYKASNGVEFTISLDYAPDDNLLHRKIVAKSEIKYPIPFGKLIGMEYIVQKTKVEKRVRDTPEFIRNYGFVRDIASQIPAIGKVMDTIEGLRGNE